MSSIKSLTKKYKKLEKENKEDSIKNSLLKKAKGFMVEEIIEEYSLSEDGQMILNKKKITTKEVPPDTNAIKYLIESENLLSKNAFENMSDEELNKEKIKLLNLLKEENYENN